MPAISPLGKSDRSGFHRLTTRDGPAVVGPLEAFLEITETTVSKLPLLFGNMIAVGARPSKFRIPEPFPRRNHSEASQTSTSISSLYSFDPLPVDNNEGVLCTKFVTFLRDAYRHLTHNLYSYRLSISLISLLKDYISI